MTPVTPEGGHDTVENDAWGWTGDVSSCRCAREARRHSAPSASRRLTQASNRGHCARILSRPICSANIGP